MNRDNPRAALLAFLFAIVLAACAHTPSRDLPEIDIAWAPQAREPSATLPETRTPEQLEEAASERGPSILFVLGSTQPVDEIKIQFRGKEGVIDTIDRKLPDRDIRSSPLRLLVLPSTHAPVSVPAHLVLFGYSQNRIVVEASAKYHWPSTRRDRYLVMTEAFPDADLDGFAPCRIGKQWGSPPPSSGQGGGGTTLFHPHVCGDCNDNSGAIFPGRKEVCGDSIDNNCNGQINEGCGQ